MHSRFCKLNFLIAFGAFFAALSLSGGCTNLFSSNSPNNDAPAQIQAKEGYGIITGSVPSANSVSPRTAMPDPDKAKPSSFKVFAENGSSTVPITVDASGNFSIQLPYGTWEITAQGLNSAGKAIYTQTKKVTLSAANSQVDLKFTLGYSTNPDDGDGEISLSVSFPPKSATSSIKAIEYTLSKGESKSVVKISEEELAAGAFKIARICEDLGTYTLTINFYGDIGNLVYRIDEKVQVYANLITDTFLEGSAPYVSGGEIVLTQALLDEFVQTTLYVDAGSGKDSNSGTQFDPLKTFNRAVEMVNNASDSLANAEFRIYLKTDVADGAFLELKDGRKLTVASADGTARTIESLERQFNVASTSELTVNDIKFQKMSFRVAGTLEMNGCEISGNTKNENGGAVYVASGGEVTITNSKLFNNEASNSGGAVFVEGGTLKIEGSTLSGNKATGDSSGGAVFVHENGTFEIKGSEIIGNEAKQSAGGGIFVKESAFTMSGCTVSGNTGAYGGGVYVASGEFTMVSGEISGNTATNNGGGIYAGGGTLTIKGGAEISGNSAATNGGGVFIGSGSLAMSGGTITENKIEYSGAITASTTVLYNGGGVYIGASGEFTMSGGTISKNTATYSGAIPDDSNVFNGGGVYVEAGGEFTMSDGEITGNEAGLFGGGVSVNGVNGNGGTFTLSSGAMISTNTANEGGGVHISGGAFKMQGGTVTQNTSAKSGGGVYVTATSTFTMTRGEISENTATAGSGGGVFVNASAFTMDDGEINGNITSAGAGSGGGIYIENNATFEMTGGEINRNTSGDSAGGIFICDGSAFTMSGGEISGNKAASNAGGVFVHKGTTFTMEAGTISDNIAKDNAGGVFVDVDDSTFTMSRGTISGNQADIGGGVYIIGDPDTGKCGTFTMENGTISGNTAETNGGGVYIYNAVFTMEDGTITENEAKGNLSMYGGGGIYLVHTYPSWPGGTFTIARGTVSKNKAANGGGIYTTSYSEFVMSGGTFKENQAAQQGVGAYINPTCAFNMSGEAKFEEDDDVYLYDIGTIVSKITVTGELDATSPVATITPSTYEDGREILTAGAGITKEQMQAICRQFALTPEPVPDGATEYTATRWGISPASSDYTKGVLGKVLNELYVSQSGSDTNLGTKENPFKTMEKAIETLKEYNDGASEYTIYVHGTITPGATAGDAMADISGFTEPLNLTIQPFPEDSQATLNAQSSTRCVNVPATETGLTLTLENLVLTGGAAPSRSGGAAPSRSGGAAQILAGTVTMESCEVKASTAYYGGGLCLVNGEFTLEDCDFTGNNAEKQGGGIFVSEATLTIEGGNISENKTTGTPSSDSDLIDGGGIYVEKSALSMNGITLEKNYANRVGGAICIENGESTAALTLESLIITDNEAGFGGGGVFVCVEHGTFAMKYCTITGNEAGNGGGIFIDSTTFTMEGCTISENNATANDGAGGGVYNAAGNVTMKSSHVNQNKASNSVGGGVASRSGATFTMESGEINGNTAQSSGGGVYLSEAGDTLIMKGGSISENTTPKNGGGVYLANGKFEMTSGTISGNTAQSLGGGVGIAGGTFTMSGGTISDNIVNGLNGGGGVFVDTNGTFNMNNTAAITTNTAPRGGGVWVDGMLNMSGSAEISGNKSTNTSETVGDGGGGVFLGSGTAKFTMQGNSRISGNTAKRPGGGVRVRGTLNMSGNSTISGNSTTGDGGGVYVASNGEFTMSGGTISGNDGAYGGGVHISNGILSMGSTDCTISRNTATGDGGGVYVASNGAFIMSGGTITGNDAQGNQTTGNSAGTSGGGGVYVFRSPDAGSDAKGIFTMTGGTIINNKAAAKGAGVHVTPDGTFNMGGNAKVEANNDVYLNVYPTPGSIPTITVTGTLTAASPVATITPASYVAGRQVLAGSGVTITQAVCEKFALTPQSGGTEWKIAPNGTGTYGVLSGNDFYVSATGNDSNPGTQDAPFATIQKAIDAVLAANDGTSEYTIYVSGTITPGATGTSNGMANFSALDKNLNLTIKGLGAAILNANQASRVIYARPASGTLDLTLEGLTITDGRTTGPGGGVYMTGGGVLNMIDCTISSNTAGAGSNAYWGGGVYAIDGCTVTMNGGTISDNVAGNSGGGVWVEGTFTMIEGTISRNTVTSNGGGGVYIHGDFTMTGGTISENESKQNGGGVHIDGTFTMSGTSKISNNKATSSGGGVYLSTDAVFTMSDGTIDGNTAKSGGGVYVGYKCTFTMSSGTISGNIASSQGGGVYIYQNGTTYTKTGGTISGNDPDEIYPPQ